jgi:hypothetical protein
MRRVITMLGVAAAVAACDAERPEETVGTPPSGDTMGAPGTTTGTATGVSAGSADTMIDDPDQPPGTLFLDTTGVDTGGTGAP